MVSSSPLFLCGLPFGGLFGLLFAGVFFGCFVGRGLGSGFTVSCNWGGCLFWPYFVWVVWVRFWCGLSYAHSTTVVCRLCGLCCLCGL